jgi:hypothetical protein
MFGTHVPAATRRLGLVALAIAIALLSAGTTHTQAAPAQQATPAANPYVFSSDGALLLNFIKPDKTADFDMIIMKLKEALTKGPADTSKPDAAEKTKNWQEMAKTWRIYKASEMGAGGAAIYVSVISPAVKGADYTVSTILAEAFPTEANALYKMYAEAFGTPSGNLLHLNNFVELGQ